MTTKVLLRQLEINKTDPTGQQVLGLSFNNFGVMEHFVMPFEVAHVSYNIVSFVC